MPVFDPTPGRVAWIEYADRLQLERELADLPDLIDILDGSYWPLLARGDRDPVDAAVRYVTRFSVLDLADRRHKGEAAADPAAEVARRGDTGRRYGLLPTLEAWVRTFEAQMLDQDVDHDDPVLDQTATATTSAGWLRRHLDWIITQPDVVQLAAEIHQIITDLDMHGISTTGPNDAACMTADDIANLEGPSRATIYRWWKAGRLTDVGRNDRGQRVFILTEVRALNQKRIHRLNQQGEPK